MRRKNNKNVKILIVDDNQMVSLATSAMVGSINNFKIIGMVTGAKEMFKFLKRKIPDIILMDVSMIPIDGVEATKYIQENYDEISVIGFSAHDCSVYKDEMINAGARDYLLKSNALPEIVNCINNVWKKGLAITTC
jgi:DNA-binding NarL/FixJ family response regulator